MILKLKSESIIELTMAINFFSFSKDSNERRTMHSKRHNNETMIGNETNEIIEELFNFLLQKH